jgi:hypothetical protein
VTDPPDEDPDLTTVSDAFPGNAEAAVPLAILVGLLDSLATHRAEITELLGAVERAGTDPFLAVDRRAAPSVTDQCDTLDSVHPVGVRPRRAEDVDAADGLF